MLTENEKKQMAQDAGWAEDKRVDDIKVSIWAIFDKDKENSIHRKTFVELISLVETLYYEAFGRSLDKEKFKKFFEYNTKVEEIKTNVQEDAIYEQQ